MKKAPITSKFLQRKAKMKGLSLVEALVVLFLIVLIAKVAGVF